MQSITNTVTCIQSTIYALYHTFLPPFTVGIV